MISVGGTVIIGGSGGGLPTAAAAGEVPVASGAGATYTAAPLGLAGLDVARPTASASYLGRSYLSTDIGPAGAISICITDGAGDYGWTMVALAPETVAISLASATGWSTTTAGGTTSTINTGTERAVLTVASGTATYTLASVARTTLPAIGRYSLQARIAAWTGVAATDTEQMLVRMTDSGGTLSDLWIYGTEAVSLTAGATVPGGAVTVAGLLTGQGWVRATIDGSQVVYACGVGSSGAAPTSWITIGSRSTATAIMHPYTSFGVLIRRTVSQVTDLVAQLGDVSYRSLDL